MYAVQMRVTVCPWGREDKAETSTLPGVGVLDANGVLTVRPLSVRQLAEEVASLASILKAEVVTVEIEPQWPRAIDNLVEEVRMEDGALMSARVDFRTVRPRVVLETVGEDGKVSTETVRFHCPEDAETAEQLIEGLLGRLGVDNVYAKAYVDVGVEDYAPGRVIEQLGLHPGVGRR